MKQAGYVFYRGLGVPENSSSLIPQPSSLEWTPEESILIAGINSEDAVKLGKKYRQAAIVTGDHGAPTELVFINKSNS